MAVVVAPAGAADASDWQRLWAGYQRHFGGDVPADVSARSFAMMVDPGSRLDCLLARRDGTACGIVHYSFTPFAWTASPVCFLQDLFVDEAARGSGAGRALIEGVYAAAGARGAANVFWLADAGDERLRAFYRRIAVETPFVRFMQSEWDW